MKIVILRNSLASLLLFLIPSVVVFAQDVNSKELKFSYDLHDLEYGPVNSQNSFRQEILTNRFKIIEISLLLATYNRENSGIFEINIVEKNTGREVYSDSYDMSEIQDNSELVLNLQKSILKSNNVYFVIMKSDNTDPQNGITWWANSQDMYPGGNSYKNSIKLPGDFSFKIKLSKDEKLIGSL